MFSKLQTCSLSSWKYQFNPMMITKSISVPQYHNPIQPMLYSNQFKDQKKFQRFFTKSAPTSNQPQNEQEIFHQVTNLLDGTNGYPKDPTKATSLLKKLADDGSTRAMMMYAGMAESGIGFPSQDLETADKYFKKASENDTKPETTLIYLQYLKQHQKQEELSKCIKKIEEEGDGNRIFVLGLFSLQENNRTECDKYLKIAIKKDNVDAMTLQASLLIKDKPEESKSLLKKAIEKGSQDAMYCYASYIAKGEFKSMKEGREKESFRYMKEAADGNVKDAVVTLAEWYLTGFFCERNVNESLKYYKKAADIFNDPFSQYFYGLLLLNNQKSDENKHVGFEYMKKSAENQFPDAFFRLGFCFMNGDGTQKNKSEANLCFKMAADSENADCDMILNYAMRLMFGEGIKKDENEAIKYFKKGAAVGNKMCIQFLKNLNDKKT